jgi:hypothetical protein
LSSVFVITVRAFGGGRDGDLYGRSHRRRKGAGVRDGVDRRERFTGAKPIPSVMSWRDRPAAEAGQLFAGPPDAATAAGT